MKQQSRNTFQTPHPKKNQQLSAHRADDNEISMELPKKLLFLLPLRYHILHVTPIHPQDGRVLRQFGKMLSSYLELI